MAMNFSININGSDQGFQFYVRYLDNGSVLTVEEGVQIFCIARAGLPATLGLIVIVGLVLFYTRILHW